MRPSIVEEAVVIPQEIQAQRRDDVEAAKLIGREWLGSLAHDHVGLQAWHGKSSECPDATSLCSSCLRKLSLLPIINAAAFTVALPLTNTLLI